jgi:KDO2-lipid IV(A) lauroyltransferase
MTIYPHKDPHAFEHLRDDLKNGSVVALVADRDLSRRGVPVIWNTPSGPREVTMPPGPVLLARKTGAVIFVVISTFVGYQMHLKFIGPITVDGGATGLRTTCQRIADVFCDAVAKDPIDWHLMQRFFPGVVAEDTPPKSAQTPNDKAK